MLGHAFLPLFLTTCEDGRLSKLMSTRDDKKCKELHSIAKGVHVDPFRLACIANPPGTGELAPQVFVRSAPRV
jgi:hypothetical protein